MNKMIVNISWIKTFALALISLCTMVSIGAQNIDYQKYSLDNGLTVILHKDNTTPIVAVSVMYHVGSKNENPNRTGFAHFFEHLLFEGTENIKRGDFDKHIQRAGGTYNANTSYDRTFYYEILPSNHLATGLWLESERMLHAKVEDIGIETQRQVVKEERRQRIDNRPYGTVVEESFRRAFTVHPYHWSVIGSMEHLDAAEESDYKQFYKDFYRPDNAILSIAGDIDFDQTKSLVELYFASIPKGVGQVYKPNIIEPPLKLEIRDTIFDNVQLPAIVQTYRIPALGEKEYYAVSLLAQLLSQGESSRMYKSLVDDQQLAVFAGNFPFDLEDPGVSMTFGIANAGVDPYDLELAIDTEIDKVQKELITEREFQKLKNQIEADFVTSNSSMVGIAESLANYEMYYGDAELINTELKRYLSVTREEIRKVAQKYFHKDKRVVLYFLPTPLSP